MKLLLPKQHGAWAMLIIPFWLGVASTTFQWQHIPFFIGWTFLYLGTYPFLLLFKGKKMALNTKWTLIYGIPGFLLLLIPFMARPEIIWFGLAMIPFFLLNIYFSKSNNERAFLNDIVAIIIFSIVGLASSFLSTGYLNELDWKIFVISVLFFIGCTFYVKTMIREKNNMQYKRLSFSYHVIVPTILLIIGEWIVAIAFIPSLIRAIYNYGRTMSIKKLGILEIVNAAIFFSIMIIAVI